MRRSHLVAALVVTAAGCGGSVPPVSAPEKCPEQNITVSVLSSPSINRTPEGDARPVVVRVYQLKSDSRLYNASFEQVWKDDKGTLTEDVISSQELEIYPASRTDVQFARPPAVNHVAAVALFSSPSGRAWFTSLDLPPVPEPGRCGAACPPGDEECESASVQSPHLVYFIDGSKVDDGVEHLEEYPTTGRMRKGAQGRGRPD